jgi:hypothetical protein
MVPPRRHGVARIQRKIKERDFDLRRIDKGLPETAGERRPDLNQPAADGSLEHVLHGANRCVQVGCLRLQMLLAGEDQELLRQLRAARRRSRGRLHQLARPLVGAEPGFEKLEIAEHAGQQVVEIVRHAPGKLSDGLHLLELPQRFFGSTPLGCLDRLRHDGDNLASVVLDRAHRKIKRSSSCRQIGGEFGTIGVTSSKDVGERLPDLIWQVRRCGEPGRLPERHTDDVFSRCLYGRQRGAVRFEKRPVQCQ